MTKQYFYRASVMYRLPTGGIEGTWFWCGVLRKMFLKKKLKGEGDLSLTKRMLGICSVSDNKWHFFYSINIWAFRNINCVHLFCYNVIKITLKLKKKEGKGRDWSSISDTLCDQYFTIVLILHSCEHGNWISSIWRFFSKMSSFILSKFLIFAVITFFIF